MIVLTESEARKWCEMPPLGHRFSQDGLLNLPSGWITRDVEIFDLKKQEVIPTAQALLNLGCNKLGPFQGGLIWIRRSGMGSSEWETILQRTCERFRYGYGEVRSLSVAPAHAFRGDEEAECAGLIALIFLAEWDAYYLPASGKWAAWISNDEHVSVSTQNVADADAIYESLAGWGHLTALPEPPMF